MYFILCIYEYDTLLRLSLEEKARIYDKMMNGELDENGKFINIL